MWLCAREFPLTQDAPHATTTSWDSWRRPGHPVHAEPRVRSSGSCGGRCRADGGGIGRRQSSRGDDHPRALDPYGFGLAAHPARAGRIPAVVPRGHVPLVGNLDQHAGVKLQGDTRGSAGISSARRGSRSARWRRRCATRLPGGRRCQQSVARMRGSRRRLRVRQRFSRRGRRVSYRGRGATRSASASPCVWMIAPAGTETPSRSVTPSTIAPDPSVTSFPTRAL